MKRHLPRLVGCVLLLALLSGCAPVIEQPPDGPIVLSDELLALMETVNLEHQAIIKPEVDEAAIVERWARDTSKYALDYQIAGSMNDGVLTAQQAKNDVNVLFYNLQTRYGLYEYFGGDKAFDPARETILQACDKAGTLTPKELAHILITNLSFVKDAHFSVGNLPCAEMTFPFHYRDVAFEKTEAGYRTLAEKKRVMSVVGYEDLDTLFRRSISSDGAIVYYPVALAELALQDYWANPEVTSGDLIVRYEDGSTQSLSPAPYASGYDNARANVELYENQSLPVLFSRKMGFDEASDRDAQAFLTYAEQLKNEPVMLLDLRSNGGGNGALPLKWLQAYTGEIVTNNFYSVKYATKLVEGSRPGGSCYISPKTLSELMGMRDIGSGLTLSKGQPDVFIENDNLIVAIIGGNTGSAAESFVDLLYNVRNALLIGDPTAGCLLGDGAHSTHKLPCSLIPVTFGDSLHAFPDGDYFQEMRGFPPDLWVPEAEAGELAIKLILGSE